MFVAGAYVNSPRFVINNKVGSPVGARTLVTNEIKSTSFTWSRDRRCKAMVSMHFVPRGNFPEERGIVLCGKYHRIRVVKNKNETKGNMLGVKKYEVQ